MKAVVPPQGLIAEASNVPHAGLSSLENHQDLERIDLARTSKTQSDPRRMRPRRRWPHPPAPLGPHRRNAIALELHSSQREGADAPDMVDEPEAALPVVVDHREGWVTLSGGDAPARKGAMVGSRRGLRRLSGEAAGGLPVESALGGERRQVERSWSKIESGTKKVKRPTAGVAALSADAKPSPLDKLPMELQIVAATMAEDPGKPVPEEALAEASRLAFLDAMPVNEEFADHEAEGSGLADDDENGDGEAVLSVAGVEFDDTFDEVYVTDQAESDDDDMVMDEAVLAKMFANLMAHGLQVA